MHMHELRCAALAYLTIDVVKRLLRTHLSGLNPQKIPQLK